MVAMPTSIGVRHAQMKEKMVPEVTLRIFPLALPRIGALVPPQPPVSPLGIPTAETNRDQNSASV